MQGPVIISNLSARTINDIAGPLPWQALKTRKKSQSTPPISRSTPLGSSAPPILAPSQPNHLRSELVSEYSGMIITRHDTGK